ncbi:hypothetical protein GJ633_07265 [Halorubrum sp. CBA1125]|uniref:hypothetical protein n=1 Tax=Halorubrum sp. CBA1125 TaxID=2668072 RepID=UPI0012E90A36|nr:hypothetical protein [Halorubrum sp. CBA1125]MUW14493.1 hypothetical protein [Halorubrum sp. CBA1125]
MTHTGTWSFATVRGTVQVAPDAIQIRRGLVSRAVGNLRTIAAGRVPPVFAAADWSLVTVVFAVLGVVVQLWGDGGDPEFTLATLGLLTAIGSIAASAVRNRETTISLRTVEHVAFDDDELVVVHREETDDGWFGDGWFGDGWFGDEGSGGGWFGGDGADASGDAVVGETSDAGITADDAAGDRVETRIRPRADAERADAAIALRLRGVDLRGVDGHEAVSRTVVDAPKTELVA